ncbi:PRC-barrel domain-containing protein [Paradesertivirga mongoliensis]|uniref:PRC-barrel domain-containing protein n=1 Tax=Paradesertivirga mongoliensis TaxID=2100740 RepID=A0ABW4ZLE2_9SPHI|nr:PRC-barrel domain-containing protein [Pedobacter mongoliensis]
MLHSIQSLLGFTMGATDGEIGKIKDFYFDDKTWKVRYLVVETGNWLVGRKVLLSPVALHNPDWQSKVLPVNLSRDQIKHSPDIDTERPVSRQQEADLHSHYSWPYNEQGGIGFMTTGMVGGVVAPDIPFSDRIADEMHHHERDTISDRGPETEHHSADQHTTGDPNLRSFKDLTGYNIHATDGEFGEVEDLLVDSTTWSIPFLVIETGNWYSGKKILTSTNAVSRIQWEDSSVHLTQTTNTLRGCPEYDYNEPIKQEQERNLYHYHQTGNRM